MTKKLFKENLLPRGFQSFDSDEYFARQKKQNAKAELKLEPFPLSGFCCQGDIDRCQVRCGACISAGGFEKLSKSVIYLR